MNISNCNFTTYTSPDPKQVKVVTNALLEVVAANTEIANLIAKVGEPPKTFNAAPMVNIQDVNS